MRVAKAKLQIDHWNGSIRAKAELQTSWFRVRGIPYDKRSKETYAFVGSLVAATMEVDMTTLNRVDYVKMKIATKDISKVPGVVEGAIIPYLYDFYYEREVEMGATEPGIVTVVYEDKKGDQPTPKKAKTGEQSCSKTQP
jgi:hypothetical protein